MDDFDWHGGAITLATPVKRDKPDLGFAARHRARPAAAATARPAGGAQEVDYIGPIPQLPGLLGIYFYDPNGIRLEFACQPEDGETPAVIPCISQTKAEARGELETLPSVTYEWIEERLAALPG